MKKIIIAFSLALVLIMVLLYFPDISSWFWREVVKEDGTIIIIAPEKIITYVGAALGGTILLFQLMENNRRNDIADRGQVNLRFKDAAMLLGSEDTASILSGIYALHQIAIECSKGKKEQRGFVKVIHDILCAYVRESAKTITNDKGKKERICSRPTVVMQTAVDVLFKNERNIYGKYKSNLSGAVFNGVDFDKATLTDVRFWGATLTDIWFNGATLTDVWFNGAILRNVRFNNATLRDVWFEKATLRNVWFLGATLTDVDFIGTKLAGYSYEDIIKKSWELTS